ncbi:hypothetical protein PIB30_105643 [Stylosanthes scabra]|uniref:CCHC-type domain-containing protein n=1 Tax=Stylosanthes scabra TaxID=79078 RepID=A0ABU6SZ35_9FABA|nr:hypothetical protein [Stylosanthes scabra]
MDLDFVNFGDMVKLFEDLRYTKYKAMYWLDKNAQELETGLNELEGDAGIRDMLDYLRTNRELEFHLYWEHVINEPVIAEEAPGGEISGANAGMNAGANGQPINLEETTSSSEWAEDFVHPWLCMDSIHATFKHSINPVPSEHYWANRDYLRIEAPIIKRPIGRPKVHKRKKDPIENLIQGDKLKKTFKVTCSKCGEKGHTYKTCKGAPSNPNWKPRRNKSRKTSAPPVELQVSQSAPQPDANEVASQPMPLAPATERTREKQPIRRKATRKSPPPSEPPSSS